MKFNISIPTKCRPLLLMSVLTAFDQLSSGKHEISYSVGLDEGDESAYEAATLASREMPVDIKFVPKDVLTIGGIWNFLSSQVEADVYLAHVDDAIPLARYWDEQIARYIAQNPALSWSDIELGNQAGYPIMSKAWLQANGGLCSEHFPFWFCDTWFEEVFQFTFNRKMLIPPNLAVGGKRGLTNNLRDLDFWWGFFNSTRRVRLLKAFELAKQFGSWQSGTYQEFLLSRQAWIEAATRRDEDYRKVIPELENARRDMRDPSEKYMIAKVNAEAFLTARGTDIWSCAAPLPEKLAAE